MPLILPAVLGFQLIEHIVRELPNEAVGLLAGSHHTVQRVSPLRNVAATGSFFADPYDQFLVQRAIRDARLELLAIYHSHPDGCTCLSDLDKAFATPWPCAQLIVALDTKGKTARLLAHRFVSKSLQPVDVLCPEGELHACGFACSLNPAPCDQHGFR